MMNELTSTAAPTVSQVLNRIAELQTETAPVHLVVGGVNDHNVVMHNVVHVTDAPSRVVHALVTEFPFVSLDALGLRIMCRG